MLQINEANKSHEIGLNLATISHGINEQTSVKDSASYTTSLIQAISLQVITYSIARVMTSSCQNIDSFFESGSLNIELHVFNESAFHNNEAFNKSFTGLRFFKASNKFFMNLQIGTKSPLFTMIKTFQELNP